MKQLYLYVLAVAAIVLVGCDNRLDLSRDILFGRSLTIQATYENVTPATKTVLHEDGHVYWTPGDAISVFYGSGTNGGDRFVADIVSDERTSSFSGNIGAVTGLADTSADDLLFWGLYPYDPDASCDGQSITTTIQAVQKGRADTFAPGFAPSLGCSTGLLLSFRSIYTGLYFTVTEPGFRSMTLRSNNGELITGRAKIGIQDGIPKVIEIVEGSDAVTVNAPTNAGFEVGKKYYVIFYPQTLTDGFTVELYSSTQKGTFSVNRSATFQRNKISNVVNLDTKSTFEPFTFIEPEGGKDSGLYFGLSTFDRYYNYYPVRLLSEESLGTYKSSIDNLQLTSDNGTLLYYSFDEDISAIQGITLPSDLSTVSIVTFTDGFDEGSTNFHLDLYDTDDEYLEYVSSRMDNETVSGVPIKSYAIGLKGPDANSDLVSFRYCLNKLASTPAEQYVYEIDANEFSQLRQAFTKIAEDLSESIKLYNVSVHFTPPSNEGLIRITFDIDDPEKKNASSSNFYIEGIYSRTDWLLHDITYHGFSANTGDVVHMSNYDGWEVYFDFEGLQPIATETEIVNSNIYTWKYNANTSTWRVNTESTSGGGPSVKVVNSSALVLLNLDLSHSLEGRLPDLKKYSKEFIETLYNSSIDPNVIKAVHLNKTELDLLVGQSETLLPTITPATASASALNWASTNPSVATVDQNGKVTGIAEGKTTIIVSSADNTVLASCIVNVQYIHVESISLNKDELSLYEGKTEQLLATISPDNVSNSNVIWKSSAPNVASVSSTGEVTGVSKGTATVTVTTVDGEKTATCAVTVGNYTPSSTPIDLSLAVTIKETGARGYIAYSELQFANMNEFETIGLTVLSGNGNFIIALDDASSSDMKHGAAAKFYNLPDKGQGITISARYSDINDAISRFNGVRLSHSYWTSAADYSDKYYYIYGSGGSLYSSSGSHFVREVVSINSPSISSFVTQTTGIFLTYLKDGVRFFVSQTTDVPEDCSPEGIAIMSSTGKGNVIIALYDASSDSMSWSSANSVYGKNNLPSFDQGLLISARYYEVQSAIRRFGGIELKTCWTSSRDESTNYSYYCISGSGGYLYSSSSNNYVRLIINSQ